MAAPSAQANLKIVALYDSSITSSAKASVIESANQSATGVFDKLFGANLTIDVTFTYKAAGWNNLLSTSESEYLYSYSDYTKALKAAAAAEPAIITLT